MSIEGLRSEFATTAHERHTQILGKPVRQDFVAKMIYRRSKKGHFPTIKLPLAQFTSNIFEQNSTKTLQDGYKSARTLTCLKKE
jgi:hypothetical protein